MVIFYFSPGSSSMAVHIALHEVGASFDSRPLSFARRYHRAADFLAINPEGKVPTPPDRRPTADRSGGDPVLSRETLSGGEAASRRGRGSGGASDFLDVVHRRHASPRPPTRPRTCQCGVRDRRSAARGEGMGARTVFGRGYSSLPPLLAFRQFTEAGRRSARQPCSSSRPHDGATGGPANDRNRGCYRLRIAGLTPARRDYRFWRPARRRGASHDT